jgi:hypothetical protein
MNYCLIWYHVPLGRTTEFMTHLQMQSEEEEKEASKCRH